MSKFLKFIVNIVLIAAIASAAAILVPPILGVSTTIVDSTAMDTNLKLGSITYSTNVDVSELQVGDEVLKENGSSTYAYVLTATDPDSGEFRGVSAANPNGQEETVMLRNSVPKVAVTVPALGYLIIAMQSVEGRLIIGLAVVLVVILFILSELWKPIPEDEDEEEETEEDREPDWRAEAEKEEPQLTARDDTGIDTEAIREAVAENQSTSGLDDQDDLADEEEFDLGSGLASLLDDETGEEENMAEDEGAEAVSEPGQYETSENADEDASGSLDDLLSENLLSETEEEPEREEPEEEESPEEGLNPKEESSLEEEKSLKEEKRPAEENVKTGTEEADSSRTGGRNSILAEALANAQKNREADTAAGEQHPESSRAGTEPEPDGIYAERDDAEGKQRGEAEVKEEPGREEEEELLDITEEAARAEDGRFKPVERPNLDKLLEEAQNSGKNPKKTVDQNTGVTVFDYTGIL